MKKKSLKLVLGKSSVSNLKTIQNPEVIKGKGFTSPCHGTLGGQHFCHSIGAGC